MASVLRHYAADRLSWAHTDLFKAGLDPFSFLIYSYLAARADSHGKAWPKQATIAQECGVSERQVRNCIERLVQARLIVVLEQPGAAGGRRSVYFLATRNEWIAGQLAKEQPANPAGSEESNRQILPVQPANPAGSHYRELNPEELNPKEAAQAPASVPDKSSKRKSKKASAPDPKSFLAMFAPDEFRHSDEFVAAWDGWGQNRIDDGNPLNERAAKIALNKLTRHPLKVAIEALERSTMNNWTGVFPESIASGGKNAKFNEASGEQPRQDFGF